VVILMTITLRRDGLVACTVDTSADELAEIVHRDGGVVVTGLLSPESVAALDDDLSPYLARREPGFRAHVDDEFYGGNTKRVQGLAVKSTTFVDQLLLHPLVLDVVDRILLPNCGDYWMSQAETIDIGPGSAAQPLHRDDLNWSIAAKLGVHLQLSVLVARGDYDADVGATMVVPGSHAWPLDRPFADAAAEPVELLPGDALLYVGSLVHGGGANVTSDRWRAAVYVGYLVGWLTPEEAVARSITPEVAARLPQRARELLGWASMRGNTASTGPEAALQLWQLDRDDLQRHGELFLDR
jgi:ectoine hydroxylase-related dioxygenase (phytanoyl-CoA dioxygenase family)